MKMRKAALGRYATRYVKFSKLPFFLHSNKVVYINCVNTLQL